MSGDPPAAGPLGFAGAPSIFSPPRGVDPPCAADPPPSLPRSFRSARSMSLPLSGTVVRATLSGTSARRVHGSPSFPELMDTLSWMTPLVIQLRRTSPSQDRRYAPSRPVLSDLGGHVEDRVHTRLLSVTSSLPPSCALLPVVYPPPSRGWDGCGVRHGSSTCSSR